jgi:hypothetical protein
MLVKTKKIDIVLKSSKKLIDCAVLLDEHDTMSINTEGCITVFDFDKLLYYFIHLTDILSFKLNPDTVGCLDKSRFSCAKINTSKDIEKYQYLKQINKIKENLSRLEYRLLSDFTAEYPVCDWVEFRYVKSLMQKMIDSE